jgi:hypothetical protein
VPLTRRQVFERIKPLETAKYPFVNLLEKDAGRWSEEAILSLLLFAVPQALKQHGGQAAAITCR